ncbi:hypothetical protein FKP32DRAFT_1024220 [Trametes sanguinea]|nr:hypothetical protein FKP32DRAFT_1024220 [Trametes sanguinea]
MDVYVWFMELCLAASGLVVIPLQTTLMPIRDTAGLAFRMRLRARSVPQCTDSAIVALRPEASTAESRLNKIVSQASMRTQFVRPKKAPRSTGSREYYSIRCLAQGDAEPTIPNHHRTAHIMITSTIKVTDIIITTLQDPGRSHCRIEQC